MKLLLVVLLVAVGLAAGRVHKASKHSPNEDKDRMVETNRSPKFRGVKTQKKTSWFDTCADCKMIVGEIDQYIDDEATIEQIKNVVNLVCDVLPASEKEECKNFVTNFDAIIHEIKPILANPQRFCASVDLCGTKPSRLSKALTMLAKYRLLGGHAGNDALCDECKFAVTEAKAAWDSKSIQTEAKDLIEKLCNSLGSYKDQCDSLVDAYFPLLVQEIDQLLSNPDTTCQEIGLCSGGSRLFSTRGQPLRPARPGKTARHQERQSKLVEFLQRARRIQTQEGQSTGCSVCVYSIGALLETVKLDPQLIESWASGIEGICVKLPSGLAWREGCQDFLNIYLKDVMLLAVETVEPKEICTLIKACSAANYQEVMEFRSSSAGGSSEVGNEVVCESCRLMAEFLKTECQSETFQQEIAGELKQICNFVPGQYAEQCTTMINQYLPYVFELIVTELDPDTVCPEISLCPQPSVQARPVAAEIEQVAEAEAMMEED